MTMSRSPRNLAAAITLSALTVAAVHAASAGEKLVGTYGEVRTILSFKVSDAAADKDATRRMAGQPGQHRPVQGC